MPAITAHWRHRVDPSELKRFHALSGLPESRELPLLYPHTISFPLQMAILTQPAFPLPIWRMLQVRNRILQHAPLACDAVQDITARLVGHRILDKGAEFDLHATVQVDGAVAWESLNTFYARGRFGKPTADAAPEAPKLVSGNPAGKLTREYGAMAHAGGRRLALRRPVGRLQPAALVERLCAQAWLRARLLPSAAGARPMPGEIAAAGSGAAVATGSMAEGAGFLWRTGSDAHGSIVRRHRLRAACQWRPSSGHRRSVVRRISGCRLAELRKECTCRNCNTGASSANPPASPG
ncbi:MAG: hypothetical protein M5R42_07370 [Rhodocyclaceae bacterium]|nr:hypothetical protein [Rhodocyclaceae bacterium]